MEARALTVQGRPVRLWSGGSGPAMLLLHGGMVDAERHWRPIWDRLATRFAVHAPDLPGFGGSAALPRSTYPRLVEWVEALRIALGADTLTLVGNSFGGSLARLYAAAHPQRTARLILLNGGSVFRPVTPLRRLMLASPIGALNTARRARGGFGREAVQRMFADPQAADPQLLAACAASNEIYEVLRHCLSGPTPASAWPDVPTLILWGEADEHVPPEVGRTHAREARNAEFRLIPAAGHLPQVEQPQATAQAILEFCART